MPTGHEKAKLKQLLDEYIKVINQGGELFSSAGSPVHGPFAGKVFYDSCCHITHVQLFPCAFTLHTIQLYLITCKNIIKMMEFITWPEIT